MSLPAYIGHQCFQTPYLDVPFTSEGILQLRHQRLREAIRVAKSLGPAGGGFRAARGSGRDFVQPLTIRWLFPFAEMNPVL